MLDAVHGNARAQHIAEHFEFGATKALTGRGGGADRAVVLQQQKTVRVGARFGHVAFARADLCQACHPGAERAGTGERRTVAAPDLRFAHPYQLFQRSLAQRRADRLDQTHGEFGVRIREAIVRRRRQVPVARGPADTAFLGHGRHQAVVRQLHQMLPRRFGRRAEHGGDVRRPQRPAALDQAEDPFAGGRSVIGRGIYQAHAWIMRRSGAARQPEFDRLRQHGLGGLTYRRTNTLIASGAGVGQTASFARCFVWRLRSCRGRTAPIGR
jgi:hypothetical protein